MERAIFAYDNHCEQTNDDAPLSGDHYTGNCFVFFKGNKKDCEEVKDFIKYLKDKE